MNRLPTAADIDDAALHFPQGFIRETPLVESEELSDRYGARILLKDETRQRTRSYKLRGAFNGARLMNGDKKTEIVCASAGNHAQGVAASCNYLERPGRIFMPRTTPQQKLKATERHGNGHVQVKLVGDTFDDANAAAREYVDTHDARYLHPFDNPDVIAGQGTIGREIVRTRERIDYVIAPVGGGGLISGVSTYFREHSPDTRIIGVEPAEAAAMDASLKAGEVVTLDRISTFVDGVAVKRPGELTFEIVRNNVERILTIPQNRVCSTFLELQEEQGIHVELAGAMSVDALQDVAEEIRGKTVVCILSGNNFDLRRSAAVIERAEQHRGLKMYLRVRLPERPQALRELLDRFGSDVSISYFHYDELGDTGGRSGQEAHPLIGLKAGSGGRLSQVLEALREAGYHFDNVSANPLLHDMLGR